MPAARYFAHHGCVAMDKAGQTHVDNGRAVLLYYPPSHNAASALGAYSLSSPGTTLVGNARRYLICGPATIGKLAIYRSQARCFGACLERNTATAGECEYEMPSIGRVSSIIKIIRQYHLRYNCARRHDCCCSWLCIGVKQARLSGVRVLRVWPSQPASQPARDAATSSEALPTPGLPGHDGGSLSFAISNTEACNGATIDDYHAAFR
jgi:hypothetical protein